ncbi:hypothetical protein J3458_021997 [Metarhizium acridum]|uniref:uncharacterized protein n=1 Tax=Metarhizium acridum TaxID=92637 RepID=UPI001C6D1104|nr:hypothetical protein J3458_021997 [Metarhizium acridum]
MTGPSVAEKLAFDRRYRKGLTHATKRGMQAVAYSPCAMTTPERTHESHLTCHDRRATLCWLQQRRQRRRGVAATDNAPVTPAQLRNGLCVPPFLPESSYNYRFVRYGWAWPGLGPISRLDFVNHGVLSIGSGAEE